MSGVRRVTAKLGSMRKPQEFIVTQTDQGRYLVQSDKSIGMFDPQTGKGLLNIKGCYFMHLQGFGVKPYDFPPEFIEQCQERRVLKGDEIGPGVIFGGALEVGG